MKIYTSKSIRLIKVFFISSLFLNLISKNVSCMRNYSFQVDTPEKTCLYIFKTYSTELLDCIKKRLDINPSEFLENFIADLLHARKLFPDIPSKISNQLIADMLFASNLLVVLKLPTTSWDNEIEEISKHFIAPGKADVIEILTMLKYRQIS